MAKWYNGTINARDIGKGCFISKDLERMKINILQNNTAYRERIELAQRMAGYLDKSLIAARGGIQVDAMNSILKQSEKASNFTKENTDESIKKSNIIISR